MFIVCWIIYCMYSLFLYQRYKTKILLYIPCHVSIPYDKYGWIGEVFNVLRIVSGREQFCLHKRPIDFATFRDISAIQYAYTSMTYTPTDVATVLCYRYVWLLSSADVPTTSAVVITSRRIHTPAVIRESKQLFQFLTVNRLSFPK